MCVCVCVCVSVSQKKSEYSPKFEMVSDLRTPVTSKPVHLAIHIIHILLGKVRLSTQLNFLKFQILLSLLRSVQVGLSNCSTNPPIVGWTPFQTLPENGQRSFWHPGGFGRCSCGFAANLVTYFFFFIIRGSIQFPLFHDF